LQVLGVPRLNFHFEDSPIADKEQKGRHYDPATINPDEAKKDEISQEELNKDSGASNSSGADRP